MTPDRAFALAAILAVCGGAVHAAPSSLVAWTPDTMERVASGDPGRGKRIAADCAACHGETGFSPSPDYPSLAGQRATYVYKQLADYKAAKRRNDIMTPLASTLTAQDMADVAAYYAAQPLPGLAQGEAPRRFVKWLPVVDESRPGGRLVRFGAPQREVTACATCHGQAGEGARVGVPVLRGQTRDYFVKTMQEYRAGQRHNDVYAVMRTIARNITDSEIDALADYYAVPMAPASGVASP